MKAALATTARSFHFRLPHCRSALRSGLLALMLAATSQAEVKVGDAFPSLASAQLAGGKLPTLAGKILVVDFWASWCAPCKASFPSFGKIAADYANRDVVVLGVSVDESAAAYAAFIRKNAPRFPALHDAQQNLVRAVGVPTMPSTFVVDRQGRVHAIHTGFHGESSERKLRAELDALIAARDATAR